MKIAIFENEYESVKGAFDAANVLCFDNTLEFVNFPSSQKANFLEMGDYAAIFIDIDLSSKSELDGFALIQLLLSSEKSNNNKIIILTGNSKIEESLKSRNIQYTNFKIIIKPTNFQEVADVILQVVNRVKLQR
jgi:DNA-binding response OmpR family regulator